MKMVGVNVKISKRHSINLSDIHYDIYLRQHKANMTRRKTVGIEYPFFLFLLHYHEVTRRTLKNGNENGIF